MTIDELSRDQLLELKQDYLAERNAAKGEGTSYGELADADVLVGDDELRAAYEGTEFTEGDFNCSAS